MSKKIPTGLEIDDDKVQAILAERALKLAQAPQSRRQGHTVELVVIRIGAGQYGVPLAYVDAIEHSSAVTLVPGLPAIWRGLVNVRGQLLPVLDLATYLGLPASDETDVDRSETGVDLVVIRSRALTICLSVDAVDRVLTVLTDQITQPLAVASINGNKVISGAAPGLVAVLDVETLLADPSLIVQDELQ